LGGSAMNNTDYILNITDNIFFQTQNLKRCATPEVLDFIKLAQKRIEQQQKEIEKLRNLSRTDDLTGLYNKRAFEECFNRAVEETKRTNESGVIAIIDLDGFKAINDTFGHLAGDKVLIYAAKILQKHIRKSDILSRIGGDEFAIIMPRTTKQKIKKRIEKLNKTLNCALFQWQENLISIKASIGICQFDETQSKEDIFHKTDLDMYKNKSKNKKVEKWNNLLNQYAR
jgi:diguanylate cyclase (GGDEF)-like protein